MRQSYILLAAFAPTLLIPAMTGPVMAQTAVERPQVRTRVAPPLVAVPRTGPVRPAQPSQTEKPGISSQMTPRVKLQKVIKPAYYCRVDVTSSVMGGSPSTKSKEFTISALDDGSLVYGGDNPMDTSHRYALVDEGEWRVMTSIGWIKGKEPPKSMFDGVPSAIKGDWNITPRIQRSTGEFSAEAYEKAAGMTATYTYSGTCSGGV